MKKKLLLFILAFLIAIPCVSAETIGISIHSDKEDTTLNPGDTLVVNYMLGTAYNMDEDETVKITGADITIYYDASVLEFVPGKEYSTTNNLLRVHSYGDFVDGNKGKVDLELKVNNFRRDYLELGADAEKILATYTFKVKKDVKVNSTTISTNEKNYVTCFDFYGSGENDECAEGYNDSLTFKINANSNSKEDNKNELSLKSLTVDKYDLNPKFDPKVKEYTVNVPMETKTVKINGTCNSDGCTVSGIGKKNLISTENDFTVTVKGETGETVKYKIKINKPADNRSSDNTLRDIKAYNYETKEPINLEWLGDHYDVIVHPSVKAVAFEPVCNDSKCSFKVEKYYKISEGINTFYIDVMAENEEVKTYTIYIRCIKENIAYIFDLKIKGYDLNPKFNYNNNEYTIDFDGKVDKLDIKYTNYNSNVKIIGNDNLKKKKNAVIKIEVKGNSAESRNVYTIKLNRKCNNVIIYLIIIVVFVLIVASTLTFVILKKKKNNKSSSKKEEEEKVDKDKKESSE